jgi:release factor glutamine methyltransferase
VSSGGEKQRTWRVLDILNWSINYLENKGIEQPRTDVEWMLTSILGLSRMELYLNWDRPLSLDELSQYKPLLLARAKRQPVQQIVGNTEFFGLRFCVSTHTFIPRPETEILVECAINFGKSLHFPRVLDIGTGAGNIAIAIAIYLPQAKIVAVDISAEAIEVAKRNGDFHNVSNRIEWRIADFLQSTPESLGAPFEIVVSNPPYIPRAEIKTLEPEVREYEPYQALTDGSSGLTFYRKLLDRLKLLLSNGVSMFVEMGIQKDSVLRSMFDSSGFKTKIFHDYENVPRVLEVHSE